MKYLFILLLAVVFSFPAFSQSEVKIGNQVWMTKNLDVDRFMNGDLIPESKTKEEWQKAGELQKPTWCYYNYDVNNKKYGKLYNGYAVSDPRGLAPAGFHIPSDAEWTELFDYLGSKEDAVIKMRTKSEWLKNGNYGNGNNKSKFSALPGGYCAYNGGFAHIKTHGYWWSSTNKNLHNWSTENTIAGYVELRNSNTLAKFHMGKAAGYSVRCIKD